MQTDPRIKPYPNNKAANLALSQRFRRLVRHLCSLGPRPVGEALLEIGVADNAYIIRILEKYAQLDPGLVQACSADDWPPPPLWRVPE